MSVNISIEEIDGYLARLVDVLRPSASQFQCIMPVLYGGLYSAHYLAKALGQEDALALGLKADGGYEEGKKVRSASVVLRSALGSRHDDGQGILIVDDVISSGETVDAILKIYPQATIAVPMYWPDGISQFAHLGERLVTGHALPQGQYCDFPWEQEHQDHAEFLAARADFPAIRCAADTIISPSLLLERRLRSFYERPI